MKPATKTAQKVVPPKPKRKEIPQATLSKMTPENLIKSGVLCLQVIANLEASLKQYTDELALRFPGKLKKEVISSPFGIAERTVSSTWLVNSDRVGDAKTVFGAEFSKYFEEEESAKVPSDMITPLREKLARQFEKYVIVKKKYRVSKLLQAQIADDKDGDTRDSKLKERVSPFISVASKTVVKIRDLDHEISEAKNARP